MHIYWTFYWVTIGAHFKTKIQLYIDMYISTKPCRHKIRGGEQETKPSESERLRRPEQGVEEDQEHWQKSRVLALHPTAPGLLPLRHTSL